MYMYCTDTQYGAKRNQRKSFTQLSFFMAPKPPLAKEQIVKLIVGAGQASPSPPVGPALGSKGVKSIDFCKVITHFPPLRSLPPPPPPHLPSKTFHFSNLPLTKFSAPG